MTYTKSAPSKAVLLLGLATLGTALAQTPATTSPLKITATTSLVTTTTVDGKAVEKLTPAATTLPGQILALSQNVANVSTGKIAGLQLSQSIPAAGLYQSNTCDVAGAKAVFTADALAVDAKTGAINYGAAQFSDKPMKTVTVKENGADVKRQVAATPADYTALRWSLPDLAAGQSVNCSVRVKVR